MSEYEKKTIDAEIRRFTTRNFERPSDCRNPEQIRYYIAELCQKIEECRKRFNYVPNWVYVLLAQYNARQNNMVHTEFRRSYC